MGKITNLSSFGSRRGSTAGTAGTAVSGRARGAKASPTEALREGRSDGDFVIIGIVMAVVISEDDIRILWA
jgi:hypothetical protein